MTSSGNVNIAKTVGLYIQDDVGIEVTVIVLPFDVSTATWSWCVKLPAETAVLHWASHRHPVRIDQQQCQVRGIRLLLRLQPALLIMQSAT